MNNENMSKTKKLILILVIANFSVLLGIALYASILAITSVPSTEPEPFSFNPKPLLYIISGFLLILALIELLLGYFTYKGKKWAAIALICFEFINLFGFLGTAAAIIQLATPCYNYNRAEL